MGIFSAAQAIDPVAKLIYISSKIRSIKNHIYHDYIKYLPKDRIKEVIGWAIKAACTNRVQNRRRLEDVERELIKRDGEKKQKKEEQGRR